MSTTVFSRDPDSVLDYLIDWTAWLDTDTIATSTWIVPDGITKASDSHTATTTTIWLSGGTAGTGYPITNRITTAGGRTDDRTIRVRVVEQ